MLEMQHTLTDFRLLIAEQKNANGAAAIREMLDDRFKRVGGWTAIKSGGIDWTKCVKMNGARACVGLELQFSARSDLLTNDLTHLMAAIEGGDIDVGVIVVPADKTAPFLTDRCPRYSDALSHVQRAKGQFSPLVVISLAHDGIGKALPKRITNLGKGSRQT